MKSLKDFLTQEKFNQSINDPSVSVFWAKTAHSLMLKFDSKDILIEVGYTGASNPWLSSLCAISLGKNFETLTQLSIQEWKNEFGQDQFFWDLFSEREEDIFFEPLELLKAALNKYVGREHLYKEESPLVCRCFGVRESDIFHYINTKSTPTVADLGIKTKAGMS